MATVADVVARLGLDARDFERGIKDAERDMRSFEKRAQSMGQTMTRTGDMLSLGLTTPITALGGFALKAAAEGEQAVGAIESVFGDAADSIDKFAETSAQAAGLTSEEVRRMAAQVGAQLKGFGFSAQEAAKETVTLEQRAADMAATFGGTTSDAITAIAALLRGERDPIERYGVSLKQVDVDARIAAKGMDTSTAAAEKQAKAIAALELFYEQTADTAGQFAREQDTVSGQFAILKASTSEFVGELGGELVPIAQDVMGLLQEWVDRFQELDEGQREQIVKILAITAALGPMLRVAGTAVSTYGKLATVMRTSAGAASAFKFAIPAAAVIGGLGMAVGALADEFINFDITTDRAADALRRFNATGEITADLAGLVGEDFNAVSDQFLNLRGVTAGTGDVLAEFGANFVSLLPFAEVEGPITQATKRFETLDEVLSGFADAGNLDAMAGSLALMIEEMDEAGFSIEDLLDQLPKVDTALAEAGVSTDRLTDLMKQGVPAAEALSRVLNGSKTAAEQADRALQNSARAAGKMGAAADEAAFDIEAKRRELGLLEDELGRTTEEQNRLTEAIDKTSNALRASTDPIFAVMDADRQYAEAIRERDKAMQEGNLTSAEQLELDQRVAEAMIDREAAMLDLAKGVEEGTVSEELFLEKMRELEREAPGATAGVVAAFEGHIGGLPDFLRDQGVLMMAGLTEGIEISKRRFINSLTNAINDAEEAAKLAARIRSPSRLFRDEIGIPIGQGIAEGVDATVSNTQSSIEAMIKAMADADTNATISMDEILIGRKTQPGRVPDPSAMAGSFTGGGSGGAPGGPMRSGPNRVDVIVELDGRTIMQAIGRPLVEEIRLRGGVRTV